MREKILFFSKIRAIGFHQDNPGKKKAGNRPALLMHIIIIRYAPHTASPMRDGNRFRVCITRFKPAMSFFYAGSNVCVFFVCVCWF